MTAKLYPPFSMFPEPKLSGMSNILLHLGPCRDEFDAKYGAGYCSSRASTCSQPGFVVNCLKTCKGCIAANQTAKQPVAPVVTCRDDFDSKYGNGYCAGRRQLCTVAAPLRNACKKTCGVCGASAAPSSPPTVGTALQPSAARVYRTGAPTRATAAQDRCASTHAINQECPVKANEVVPATCDAKCATPFMRWYGMCVQDARIRAIDARLHDGLHKFFLLCAKAGQN